MRLSLVTALFARAAGTPLAYNQRQPTYRRFTKEKY
jgi:hypothetical protein